MRILVVDDEKKITTVLKAYLLQDGFRVSAALNGLVALTERSGRTRDYVWR